MDCSSAVILSSLDIFNGNNLALLCANDRLYFTNTSNNYNITWYQLMNKGQHVLVLELAVTTN